MLHVHSLRGPTDKAPDYGSGDCEFESHRRYDGELDQLADRPLSMREVRGSKPRFSIFAIVFRLSLSRCPVSSERVLTFFLFQLRGELRKGNFVP